MRQLFLLNYWFLLLGCLLVTTTQQQYCEKILRIDDDMAESWHHRFSYFCEEVYDCYHTCLHRYQFQCDEMFERSLIKYCDVGPPPIHHHACYHWASRYVQALKSNTLWSDMFIRFHQNVCGYHHDDEL